MRLAFLGTPPFAATCLEALAAGAHDIAAVYTQPPAPRGRGQALRPSAVQATAEALGLTVRAPVSLRDADAVAKFHALGLDAAVVVAYGQILSADVLGAPRLGCFNLHASLLPRWRGAAPIQRALMAGDAETGVQVMRMTEGLDEGAILMTATTPIAADDTAGALQDRLAGLGAAILPRALDALARGEAVETPQAAEGATYARKIVPAETRLDWSRPAAEVDLRIRGLSPAPGAWFEAATARGALRVKVLMSRVEPAGTAAALGSRLDDELLVACGDGRAVRLLVVQPAGGVAQPAEAFVRGRALGPGPLG